VTTPAPTPRLATPGIPVRRFNDRAVLVGKLLHASGHEPSDIVFDTLHTIHNRCPGLSFRDFVAGCALAITLAEAASAERGHS
jgi:hypothetical protein